VGLLRGAIAISYLCDYRTMDIIAISGYIIGYSIAIMILGLVGGVIGVLIKKYVFNQK
jgi:hypothetical protein